MGKGRSKKETQSGRPRNRSKKHWFIRQQIISGTYGKFNTIYVSKKDEREQKVKEKQKHFKRRRFRSRNTNRDTKNIKVNENRKKQENKVKKKVMMKKKPVKKSLLDLEMG